MTNTDNDLDEILRGRFGDAMSELSRARTSPLPQGQSPEFQGRRANRSARRLQAGAALLAVLALGAVPAYAAGRASAATPAVGAAKRPPVTPAVPLASLSVVQKAVSAALSERTYVQSVSRIEVKLVTYADFERVWSAGVTGTGVCDEGSIDPHVVNGEMYVVAMSGDFLTPSSLPHPVLNPPASNTAPVTPFNPSAFTTTHWAAIYIPTDPDGVPEAAPRFEIANVGNTASWPPCFDLLTQAGH
jgi:hypothetical protein